MTPPTQAASPSALGELQALRHATADALRPLQTRAPAADAPRWLELALTLSQPGDHAGFAKDLALAMTRLGEDYGFWTDESGQPKRWWADAPEEHLTRIGITTLAALGHSTHYKLPDLPTDTAYCAYAESTHQALEWLHQRAEHLGSHRGAPVPVSPLLRGPASLADERWGLHGCQTLGPAFDINVLLAAGPTAGALARLRLQAVLSEGAWLTLAPVPASACLLLDADFGQMLTDLRDWLRSRLTDQPGLHPLQNTALAWDLTPAVGERIGLDAISGDSAGTAFACAALQVLSAHTQPALRAQLALARLRMGGSFMSAAITAEGGLRPVGWVNAKSQAIAPLARWATRHASPSQKRTPLLLAHDQKDLDDLPACFDPQPCTTVEALVQAIASSAEHLSPGQQAFLEAWYAPPPVAHDGDALPDTDSATPNPWPLDDDETPYREEAAGLELPEKLLNPLVDRPADHPVSTLRQAAMQGVARWQRQAGGRLRHQFVPLSVNPEDGRRFGLEERLRARSEPHEHLQPLLAELDHGSHKAYLLTGLPGAGKTVLLRRHMLDACTLLLRDDATAEAANEPWEVPIYVPLNRFPSDNPATPPGDPASADWWATSARAYVLKLLREQGWQEPMLAPFLNGSSGADTPNQRFRWHLDGLNELPMPPDDPDQDRGDRARWVVQGFLDAFRPALKPLLSVRSEHFQDDSWLTVSVQPWEPRHIKAYLRKFFLRSPRIGQTLWNALAQDPSLMDLCRRPMHLNMQCELAAAGSTTAASDRASLYLTHLWLRLKRGLGQTGDKAQEDPALAGTDLLSADDRRTIKNTRLDKVSANDLRRLPLQGLLVRGLLDQAESQYWQDDEDGRQASERCKVALEVDYQSLHNIGLHDAQGQPVRDPELVRRWLRAAAALGLLQTNERESVLEFSHQSWGEFFASLRLLDTLPDELERQIKAGVPGAKDKWDRAMVRPFKHLLEPVSVEAERQALRDRVNRRWAVALPLLRSLPLQTLPGVSGRWLGPVALDAFKASVNMAYASDEAVQQRYAIHAFVNEGALRFDTPARCVWTNLESAAVHLGIPVALDPVAGRPWADEPAVWEELITSGLFACFETQVWQHLRTGDDTHSAINEDTERELRELPVQMDLPATSDVQEVFNLALQGLPQKAVEAWLRHWCARLPHSDPNPYPQAWRVLVPAVLALSDQLEPPDGSGRITGLGLWHQPHPLLQHLRRWLLLASTDAGAAARERVHAAGLLAALDAPIPNLPSDVATTWAALRTTAFAGEGLDLLLRLQAGLLLGELGDNIRYERCQHPPQGQPERVGIRLRKTFWAAVPASGPLARHRIGASVGDTEPVFTVPAGAMPPMRFAQTPAVVMQWQAYVEDLHARGQAAPDLWSMGKSRFSNHLQPITSLDWFTARAFTEWMQPLHGGLFPELNGPDGPARLALPTEVQHEAAVRWTATTPGAIFRSALCSLFRSDRQALWPHNPGDNRDLKQMPLDLFNHSRTRWGAPAPVGVFSAALTPTGIEAMGNVWTWCSNVYSHNYEGDNARLAQQPYRAASREEWLAQAQAEGAPPSMLALRGGSYNYGAGYAWADFRVYVQPVDRNSGVGLRWQMSRPIF